MLANLRRKMGMVSGVMGQNAEHAMVVPSFMDPSLVAPPPPPPFTMEELGMTWPATATGQERLFSPSAIPVWLQEQVRSFCHDTLRFCVSDGAV